MTASKAHAPIDTVVLLFLKHISNREIKIGWTRYLFDLIYLGKGR